MSIRDTLRRAAGLLVELPEGESGVAGESPASPEELDRRLAEVNKTLGSLEDPASRPASRNTKTVEQIANETSGPNLQQVQVAAEAAAAAPSPVSADGRVDFNAIYHHSSLPESTFTAEQMLEMLGSLPAELPLEMKRQTVKVSLNAMGKALGATPETIVADASRKLAALTAYVEGINKQTADFVANTQLEIAALEKKIAEKRAAIERIQQKLARVTEACQKESDRLDDVLEFFSLDVAPSRYAGAGSQTPKPPSG